MCKSLKKIFYITLKKQNHLLVQNKCVSPSPILKHSNTSLKYLLFISNFAYLGMCPYSGTMEWGNALKGTPNILP